MIKMNPHRVSDMLTALKPRSTKAKTQGMPTLDETPEFAAAIVRYKEIAGQIEETEREIERLWRDRGNRTVQADKVQAAAQALLDGSGDGSLPPSPTVDDRVEALMQRKQVLQSALKMQQRRYEALRCEIQDKESRTLRPRAEEIMLNIVEHLKELGSLVEEADSLAGPLKRANKHSPRVLPDIALREFRVGAEASGASARVLREIEHAYGIQAKR